MVNRTVILPAGDVYVIHPLGIFDKEIELIFRTPEAVDSALEQLQRIKQNLEHATT
jgi:hypothetical protein